MTLSLTRRRLASLPMRWDADSDQPYKVRGQARRLLRAGTQADWALTGTTAVPGMVLSALAMVGQRARWAAKHAQNTWHIGVGVDPLAHDPQRLRAHLDELGCQHILVRFEWRRIDAWPRLRKALAVLDRPTLAVLVQDRAAVCDHRRWRAGLRAFYRELPAQVEAVQALQAVNRLKWGCATVGEAVPLAGMAWAWHRRYAAQLPLLGSSVIDFEPLATWRSLIGLGRVRYDAAAALLYVDRRGGPDGKQYGWFDFAAKLRATAALVECSPHCAERLWLTEVNWPLVGQGACAPTSQTEAVSEEDAATYLAEYLRIARASGLVERVYPWQLVAQGYGLVEPGTWRQRPAFAAVQAALATG